MNNKTYFLALCSLLLLWSCGKDDAPPPPKNNLPNIVAQTFTVAENIPDAQLIGTVKATDADKDDELIFSMAQNDNGLFEITKAGGLSLATGKSLNYEAKAKHTITIAVTDGSDEAKAQMTINVTQVDPENLPPTMEPQTFTASENIPDTQLIGTVTASDPEEDELTFSILEDTDQLFEITAAGGLSLAEGNTLDFATKQEHTLEVQVSDGNSTVQATMTVKVVQTDPENQSPTMEAQSFEANEDITDTDIIGTVTATDPEGDALTFSLVEDLDGLFEITEAGELSLAEGKSLDFETQEEHTLTISASDGNGFAQAIITITVGEVNEAPSTADQAFEVAEDIADTDIIGTAEATDPEGDALTFILVEDLDGLFEISEAGELSLAQGKTLDFETQTEHVLTIGVSDGTSETVELTITVTVTDVEEGVSLFDDPASFITKWQVEPGQSIIIGTSDNKYYDFIIDWGDDSAQENISGQGPNIAHEYGAGGEYTVAIKGIFPHLIMSAADKPSQDALVDVIQWGTTKWQSLHSAFYNCTNLVDFSATDKPDLSECQSLGAMFLSALNFNGNIGHWDVSNISDMGYMFMYASSFNQDIGGWETMNVTNLRSMFFGASSFNQDINGWITEKVTNMGSMFNEATAFNHSLSLWDTGNVFTMSRMFKNATSFNQDIGNWDTKKVNNMHEMFMNASSFDQNLGGWDISSITDMTGMFNNSGMSYTNANATLVGWANFVQENDNQGPYEIPLGMQGVILCGMGGDYALNTLFNSFLWNITGFDMQFDLCP
ncbi:MAG: BspA family leucine-rich repeat surface protein [Allomuricauda sp.]